MQPDDPQSPACEGGTHLCGLADVDALREAARDPRPGQQMLLDRMAGLDEWIRSHDVRVDV